MFRLIFFLGGGTSSGHIRIQTTVLEGFVVILVRQQLRGHIDTCRDPVLASI
jgi:hypothetical protein